MVRDCSFDVEDGKFTVMIGPSGAGKSTLIRLIGGFERPTSGEILADGRRVTGPGQDRQVVFQETALFPWMTADENLLYGPKARGEMGPAARRRADDLLDRVGLRSFRDRYPRHLSGGMQRRAELGRAMVNDPGVMILDEPFRGLDALTKQLMLEYYADLALEQRRTNFFVTTDVDEAIFLADRLLVMTHIPMRVRAVIDVDLPRPRDLTALVGRRPRQRDQAAGPDAASRRGDEGLRRGRRAHRGRGLHRCVPAAIVGAPAGSTRAAARTSGPRR